jgi:hypothetical protein
MHMFRFDGPNPLPSRTSNHEALIAFHEMGHYITNRLVGNAMGLTNSQGEAMGEGWGDFFAASMTSQATDNFASGTFAVGEIFAYDRQGHAARMVDLFLCGAPLREFAQRSLGGELIVF